MEMKPNPQCSNAACLQRQVINSDPVFVEQAAPFLCIRCHLVSILILQTILLAERVLT